MVTPALLIILLLSCAIMFDICVFNQYYPRYVTSSVLDAEESSLPLDVLAAMCCGPSISYIRVVAGLYVARVGRKARVDGIIE